MPFQQCRVVAVHARIVGWQIFWEAIVVVNGREATVERYLQTSRRFIEQAHAEFAAGDMRQASEKAWGAAAQAVKATAEHKGWEHGTYARLFEGVSRISSETGDTGFHVHFHIANSLRQNFYEGWQPDTFVQTGILRVNQLVDKLAALITEE